MRKTIPSSQTTLFESFSRISRNQKILVIDDDEGVAGFLRNVLKDKYDTTVAFCATEGFSLIDTTSFDVVVTDLKLPDHSGIEVLEYAKRKDRYTEVIIVTGFASLDSATSAVNLGAASYLTKPVRVDEFMFQVEKAVANRAFHLKSRILTQDEYPIDTCVKEHVQDISTLYHFSRKLMLSFEVPEILMIILEEINERLGTSFSAIGIRFLDFNEIFAMPRIGAADVDAMRSQLLAHWDRAMPLFDKKDFRSEAIALTIYNGRQGEPGGKGGRLHLLSIPMLVMGQTIGSLSIFRETPLEPGSAEYQFAFVFATFIASIVEHAYLDMQARMQATTDSLTGIANHRMFQETLIREISRAERHDGTVSLIILDIDNFKSINDTYGHLVGDSVIKELTSRIANLIRRGDLLARYGGEEFALILPQTDTAGAAKLAERMRRVIAGKAFAGAPDAITCTISLGVATYHGRFPRDRDTLIAEADKALYAAKNAGKNKMKIYASS